ncbi:MAG: excinuclease ABC subunit UvrC [Nitrospinae bacterium]|nr:excinuclease ABC subunit UvrC [Nitrospinota bacterium]
MNDRFDHLRDILGALPPEPGVYRMKDANGTILYIGKAKSLRQRVRSYFQTGAAHSSRIALMVGRVADIDLVVTASEMEALVLEDNMIKESQPFYNVLLKDDKSYPYLKLTAERYPRLLLVRKVEKDGAAYFGPYVSAASVRTTLRLIHRLFPLRQSKDNLDKAPTRRPCLNYQMRRCLAPCAGETTPEENAAVVEQVKLFLKGKNEELLALMEKGMWEAAHDERFEVAARYRDQIEGVRRLNGRQSVTATADADEDVIAACEQGGKGIIKIYQVRNGKFRGERHFVFDRLDRLDRPEALAAFIRQFYTGGMEIPREVLVAEVPDGVESLEERLSAAKGRKVNIVVPQRGRKAKLVEMAEKNAALKLAILVNSEEGLATGLAEIAALAGLEDAPKVIEGYDISHTSGLMGVGSVVVFTDGAPNKKEYRKYKIKSVGGNDDFASLAEVIERRFSRMAREGAEFPDLLLIDGGKGQLSSVVATFERIGIEPPPILGVAKGEDRENPETDLFLRPGGEVAPFPPSSAGRHLLQRVRDEAHRFAVAYHTTLRDGQMTRSALDEVEGIGGKRKAVLLKTFGSVKGIRAASAEDIAKALKVSVAVAEKIHAQL